MARQGPSRQRSAATAAGEAVLERRPRLDRAALEDVGDPRLRQARQRRRRARADLRAGSGHPHRLEARERRLVDRQHQPQERAPLVDHLRGERDDVGPLVGRAGRAPPRGDRGSGPGPPSPRAPRRPGSRPGPDRGPGARCRAGWSRGPARGRDRGSSPRVTAATPAAGERRGQPGAQQRRLADARSPHEGDDARLAGEELVEERDLVGAAEEGLGAPLVKRHERAEEAARGGAGLASSAL